MKTTEIADAVAELARTSFDAAEFPFQFLAAFGANETTIRRLKSDGRGGLNRSDVEGAVLISGKTRLKSHIIGTSPGGVEAAVEALQNSPATERYKVTMLVVSDGEELQAIDQENGEALACSLSDLPKKFGFFFPWLGISAAKEIRENPIDIQATGHLDKLYVALLQDERNKDWADEPGRARFNHFMAQLIFCFYAEDTSIFDAASFWGGAERPKNWAGLFTETVRGEAKTDGSDTRDIISEIFRAMNIDTRKGRRDGSGLPTYADKFPYVNGGLFGGDVDVPYFSRMARTYLIRAGELKWTDINPDIFGSMIQAVADDKERGNLGMHYTSVPNILKVLNPLFLDDLETQLERSKTNRQQLGKLKKRLAGIRVFDPACGSGNFLVIAYKKMRDIEHRANLAAGWGAMESVIPIRNFCGIEIKHFAAEVARLALVIAKYQCDAIYLSQRQADALFLPLDKRNWIVRENALRVDWLGVCPPPGQTSVRLTTGDLLDEPLDQAEIDFENEGGEVFICGNPPYTGKGKKSAQEKADMDHVFRGRLKSWGYVDYVSAWILKGVDYIKATPQTMMALVATNSVSQGRQVPQFWPSVFENGCELFHAHQSFKWKNNAAHNAGVTCVIVGIKAKSVDRLKTVTDGANTRVAEGISPYLIGFDTPIVISRPRVMNAQLAPLLTGSVPNDDGQLIEDNKQVFIDEGDGAIKLSDVRPFFGSSDFIKGNRRFLLLIHDEPSDKNWSDAISKRLEKVREHRLDSAKRETREQLSKTPHKLQHLADVPQSHAIIVPSVSSERREWFPCGLLPGGTIVSNLAFQFADAPLWHLALIASKLHLAWIATVCGKLKTDFRYSNSLAWNTFPVPPLSNEDKAELTRSAENILLAREQYFPATIAEMYDPDRIDTEFPKVRAAHDANDELIDNIYIGRCFRNDTERLEKLFEMYVEMTGKKGAAA